MKLFFTVISTVSAILFAHAQTGVIWSEDFNQSSSSCDPEDAPWNWNVTAIGAQGSDANYWYIDTTVNCYEPNTCYSHDTSQTNKALYIGIGNICDSALYGPLYRKGCDNATEKRVESPTIDCSGQTNLQLDFDCMAKRYYLTDVGIACFSDDGGASWIDLGSPLYTGYCPTYGHNSGFWKHYTIALPSSANNNPNVKIGFRWLNNDDCYGSLYSIAIDNIILKTNCNLTAVINGPDTICCNANYYDCTGYFSATNSIGTNSSTTYHWDFGNGDTSPLESVSYGYHQFGDVTVTLIVDNGNGCSDTATQLIRIHAIQGADFYGTPLNGTHPLTVAFTNTTDPTNITGYLWKFYNTTTGLTLIGTSTLTNPSFTFNAAGNYTIDLQIFDTFGCNNSIERVNYVNVY